MSTTWKSLAAGFTAGVVSTGVFALYPHALSALLWVASIGYIVYQYAERNKE